MSNNPREVDVMKELAQNEGDSPIPALTGFRVDIDAEEIVLHYVSDEIERISFGNDSLFKDDVFEIRWRVPSEMNDKGA